LVQAGAGVGSGISDSDFVGAGARVVGDVESVWGDADLVLKVKEPVAEEYGRLHEGLVLFTYLHLAADEALTRELLGRGVTSIAYETVELADHSLPLLSPMSEIALLQSAGGRGVLFGGGSGVRRGRVSVLGGGVAGLCAARVAAGMGADVTVFDVDVARMRYIDEVWGGRIGTRFSSPLA
ncbi:alanine dehydrogenase, partial [Xanthomonas citri pv. citri]|nr:alanine dehydrogenase [Xanthomonas citri pv. citri]